MTARRVRDIAHSVRDRLANKARETGRPFQEILTYYAIERFLYRLSASRHADRFVLKGALMIQVWDAPRARPTRDADFLGYGDSSVEGIERVIREVIESAGESDGMRYDPATVTAERIRAEEEYDGVRVRFFAYLQQARVGMQLDIGFGDVVVPDVQIVDYPVLLADFAPPRVRGYTPESVIAEKFDAMVSLGEVNSRFKDFYDVWFLARQFDFQATLLGQAVEATFRRRGTELTATPIAWNPEFASSSGRQAQWAAFLRRSEISDAPESFVEVVGVIRAFLSPVVSALVNGVPPTGNWRAPGPWSK